MIGINQSTITTRNRGMKFNGMGTTHVPGAAGDGQHTLDFQSVLRIRPLQNKEKEDHIVLEKVGTKTEGGSVVVMHPLIHLTSPEAKGPRAGNELGSPNFIQDGEEKSFHFDKILEPSASQENVFYSIGLPLASSSMESLKKPGSKVKNTLLLAMGVTNSGKTFTTFGKVRSNRNGEAGLLPRILESLFSQSRHHVSRKAVFATRITMMLVEKEAVKDLLFVPNNDGTPTKKKLTSSVMAMVANFERGDRKGNEVEIEQDAKTDDFKFNTTSHLCRDISSAKDVLHKGLSHCPSSRLGPFGKQNSRGHVVVAIQPVLLKGTSAEIIASGGTIAVVDVAGIEKVKQRRTTKGNGMRDSIAADSSIAAIMHCLRKIKHNQNVVGGQSAALDVMCDDEHSVDCSEISCVSEPKLGGTRSKLKTIPWRQSKVTMLLQPLFSPTAPWLGDTDKRLSATSKAGSSTSVVLFMSAYPGHRDYGEKRSLLNDFELLHGAEVARHCLLRADTGLDFRALTTGERLSDIESTTSVDDLVVSDDEDLGRMEPRPSHSGKKLFRTPPVQQRRKDSLRRKSPSPSAPQAFCSPDEIPITLGGGFVAPVLPPSAPREEAEPSPRPPSPAISNFKPETKIDFNKLNDLPGVRLPTTKNAKLSHESGTKENDSPAATPNSHRSPFVNARRTPSPLRATVVASPNIQPPVRTQLKSTTPTRRPLHKADQSPKRQLPRVPGSSPTTKHRASTKVRSQEFIAKENPSQDSLRRRIGELEAENQNLLERNRRLEDRCNSLMNEKRQLIRDAGRRVKQREWTELDEAEFRHSRKLRHNEQQLIHSPLWKHIVHVQNTHDNSQTWKKTSKTPFSLDFPNRWVRAGHLDKEDKRSRGHATPTEAHEDDSKGVLHVERFQKIKVLRDFSR